MTRPVDLFSIAVAESRVHVAFRALRDSPAHAGARTLMNAVHSRMANPDGNFIKDFQSDGFHSRMFEIACFAFLETQGLRIERTYERPDFIVTDGACTVAVEATSANPTSGRSTDISVRNIKPQTMHELDDACRNEFPFRMGRVLLAKLKKKYWAMPHCRGLPLVLLVSPFHEPGSVFFPDDCLARYLYGVEVGDNWGEHHGLLMRNAPVHDHKHAGKSLPSNFFVQPDSEHVSAVLYANALTVPRFHRLAILQGLQQGVGAVRRGEALLPDGNGHKHIEFEYDIRDPSAPRETWWEGVTAFINPNARIQVPVRFFRCSSMFQMIDGRPVRTLNGFHPLVSWTLSFDVSPSSPNTGS